MKFSAAREMTKQEELDYAQMVKNGTDNTMDFRLTLVDKSALKRGRRSKVEVPVKARARGLVPGYGDRDSHEGRLGRDEDENRLGINETYASVMPDDAMTAISELSLREGWSLMQADVDSAFL